MPFDDDRLYDAEAVSKEIHITKSCLGKWRHLRRGPPFVKIGRRVAYRGRALNDWLEAQVVETVAA